MKFIELTDAYDGKKVIINIDNISCFTAVDDNCTDVRYYGGKNEYEVRVAEDCEHIFSLIAKTKDHE